MITYAALCTSISNTFKDAGIFTVFQNYNELTEQIPTYPLGRCYPNNADVDYTGESVDRSTFRIGVRNTRMTITLDAYARPRSQIGVDIEAQIKLMDAIDGVLVAQESEPFFGNTAIKMFSWSLERVTFTHEGNNYAGIECKITLIVF